MPVLDTTMHEMEADEATDYLLDRSQLKVRTIMIAECVSFDAEKNTVNVQPLLKRKIDGEIENYPVITDVPVAFYGAGGMVITFQPQPGDVCELWINDRSMAAWKLSGGIVDPNSPRHHNLSDAVAYFGLNAYPNAYPDIKSGIDIRSRDGGTSLNVLNGVVNLTINGTPVALMGQDGIAFMVPVTAPDFTTDAGVSLQGHTHGGVERGGSNTGMPNS